MQSKLKKILLFSFLILGICVSGVFVYVKYFSKKEILELPQIKITIPEGYTAQDIAEKFSEFQNFNKNNFLELAQEKEGYLFPDTYMFYSTDTEIAIIKKMADNFLQKAGKVRPEIVIMASILEKEANNLKDRKIISGILWKRMEEDMRLQVDATLNYINGKTSAQMTQSDLATSSPYNTYVRYGLPPTPICNPGLDSIQAALEPTETEYWYYLSDSSGKMHYSKTFEEHKANKAVYLQ